MHPGELRELLLLRALPGIGDLRFRELMEAYGSPRAALRATGALGPRAAAGLRNRVLLDRVEVAALSVERDGVAVITVVDDGYPPLLRQLYDPPAVLFARGDPVLARGPGVAVIGSRKATPYGRDATRLLATGVARAGYVIISGLARGIDREAHEAALACGGRTVAVVGCGIDVVYPHGHEALQERIAVEGLLLSEFLPGEPPRGHNFPKRNRLIAALAQAVLVVEASATSGAIRTVDSALELGRDVFAVPGPIGRETSEGTNRLIQSGAKLIASVPDVLDELRTAGGLPIPAPAAAGAEDPADRAGYAEGWKAGREARRTKAPAVGVPGAPGGHDAVVVALGREALHVDAVAAGVGLSSAAALTALLELELDGRVVRLPGMRFTCR
jgi:DNA processing protein